MAKKTEKTEEAPLEMGFEEALKEVRASVTPEMEREYEQLAERLKQERPDGTRRIGFARDGGDSE